MRGRTLPELITLAGAGAGLTMSAAGWQKDELIRIIGHSKATITLRDVGSFTIEELVEIVRAGSGRVVLSDKE